VGEQLSYWQLIVDASIIVKLVMLVLLGLSTLTWVFIFERRSVINDSLVGH
jgi:biopolymer transport protein TolQ